MKLRSKKSALIIIDIQKAFDEENYWGGNRNNKKAEKNSQQILEEWRTLNLPIFHIRHSSQNPNSKLHQSNTGFEIKDEVKPIHGERVITKKVNSAFIGTDLKKKLDENGITTLVIIGLTTDHCVSTTTRMAANYGYETILIADATATFDRIGINGKIYSSEVIYFASLASLKDEFAEVISTKKLFRKL